LTSKDVDATANARSDAKHKFRVAKERFPVKKMFPASQLCSKLKTKLWQQENNLATWDPCNSVMMNKRGQYLKKHLPIPERDPKKCCKEHEEIPG